MRYKISQCHNYPLDKIKTFLIGPDLDLWEPIDDKERQDFILWKGNSKQFVKDVEFGLELQKHLEGKYKFKFIGYPNPYNYNDHISLAKKAKLQIITSLSETMSLSMLEGWCSKVPSISHPKIYMFGKNYETGIVTNKTIQDYAEAINELINDEQLYMNISSSCRNFILENFHPNIINKRYEEILDLVK